MALFFALVLWVLVAPNTATDLWVRGGKFPLYIIRSELSVVPMKWLWCLDGLRAAPLSLLIGCATLAFVVVVAHERSLDLFSSAFRRLRLLFVFLLVSAVCGALVVDSSKNMLFGDGIRLAKSLRNMSIEAAEVGTSVVFLCAHWILRTSGVSENILTAIGVVSCFCGGLYALGVSLWANGLKKILGLDTTAQLLLLLGGLLSGVCVMFFGYFETTQIVAALIAVLFGALAQFFATSEQRKRERLFRWIVAIVGLSVCAHTGAVSLFPLLVVVTVLARRSGIEHTAITIVWLAVLPITLVLAPFYARGEFGNVLGGGDGIMFVPFYHVPPAWPRTDHMVYYSMFSWPHLIDMANAIISTSPVAVFSLATATFWRRGISPPPQQYTHLLVCSVAAAVGCGSIVALWNFDFGMWGDWNICAAYLVPLHFCAWTVLAAWLASPEARTLYSRIVGIILCQIIALLGLAYQFW